MQVGNYWVAQLIQITVEQTKNRWKFAIVLRKLELFNLYIKKFAYACISCNMKTGFNFNFVNKNSMSFSNKIIGNVTLIKQLFKI